MENLFMKGCYDLTKEKIENNVKDKSIGYYILGEFIKNDFIVKCVGRSDSDLKQSLKDYIGKYSKFQFQYTDTDEDAFNEECKNYHKYGESEKLDNKDHPKRPYGFSWQCPKCSHFYKAN